MKKSGLVVCVLLLLGVLFFPWSVAKAATEGFYNLTEVTAAWDGTDADRTKAPTADYDYTYGDESSVTYALPWAFNFYGQSYTQIITDTNGNVWFGATGSANSFNLAVTGRGPVIAAWNNDLSSYYYGGVFIQHKTNPERVVIERQAETFTEEGYNLPNNFEVVLFPDGIARIDYQSFTTDCGKDYGSGISKGDGTASLSVTARYGNAFTLAGRSFAFVTVPTVQISSPMGIIASNTPLLNYTVGNGTVAAVKVDGQPVVTLAGQNLSSLSDGPHTVTVEAVNSGGPGSVTTTFTVDMTPPAITVAGVADGGAYNTDIAPVVTVSDTHLKESAATLNGAPFIPGTTLSVEGTYVLAVSASDLAGNYASLTADFVIDKTPPVSAGTVGTPQYATNGLLTVSGRTPVTITAQDTGIAASGVAGIEYQVDGASAWTPYAAPLTLAGLADGSHSLSWRAFDRAGNKEFTHPLAVTLDTTPPVVNAAPIGGIYGTGQSVTLTASETATIYYTTDGTAPTASSSVYGRAISVPASANLKYFAKDLVGNTSEVSDQSYIIDTTPPVLSLSALADGAYTNNETLNVAGTVLDDTGLRGLRISDTAVPVNDDGSFSYPVSLKSVANTVTTVATDLAGNRSSDTRTIILDQSAPALVITLPPDNSKNANALIEVSGTVDKQATIAVNVNNSAQPTSMNGLMFTATALLSAGYNTVGIAATDLAGNISTQKRTVIYDDQKPALAVTEPSQDIRTSKVSLAIKGTASDPLTAVGVTITKDGETLTPLLVNGTFQQIVTFTEEKPYAIVVTATNEAGTATSMQRNVIYDITPPALIIGPVTSPTNQASQEVSGTREDGATIAVTCTTATVGAITYPSATTWKVVISGLNVGENAITVVSADVAGNQTMSSAKIVFAERAPDVTITATPSVLWPPEHKMVPVTLSGEVIPHGSDILTVAISVADEYGKYSYRNQKYGDTVLLEAWRDGNDLNGRIYTITAVVIDKAGNTTTKTATVIVPHDVAKEIQ